MTTTQKCFLVLPCYNENKAILKLLSEIKAVIQPTGVDFTIVVVDDHSTDNTLSLLQAERPALETPLLKLSILKLAVNQGHQGAIYAGLQYCQDQHADRIIVMDSDGEDDPAVIPALLQESLEHNIVLVKRGKRKEGILFLAGYFMYKLVFKFLTGARLTFGNYSIISAEILDIILSKNRFIHYASTLSKLRIPKSFVVSNRRERLDGKSKMSYSNLILHGIKSFVEYADELLITVLKIFVLNITIFIISIGWVIFQKLFTNNAIPGWAGSVTLLLLTATIISLGFFVSGIFLLKISNNQQVNTIKYEVK